LPGYI